MSEAKSRGKIIVFGAVFWYPLDGVTCQFLHYLIGLRRLGYDIDYIGDSGALGLLSCHQRHVARRHAEYPAQRTDIREIWFREA
jgi:hypothetical protein